MARGYASTRFLSSVSPCVPFAGFLHHVERLYPMVFYMYIV